MGVRPFGLTPRWKRGAPVWGSPILRLLVWRPPLGPGGPRPFVRGARRGRERSLKGLWGGCLPRRLVKGQVPTRLGLLANEGLDLPVEEGARR